MMKVFLAVTLLCFVGFIDAQPVGCCIPGILQGDIWFGDSTQQAMVNEHFYWDFYAKMARYDVLEIDGSGFIANTLIVRGDLGNAYLLYPNGVCYYEPIKEFPNACIPSGGASNKAVIGGQLDAVIVSFPAFQNFTDFAYAHNCVPLWGAFFQRHASVFNETAIISYFNLVEVIADPLVFEAPTGCVLKKGLYEAPYENMPLVQSLFKDKK